MSSNNTVGLGLLTILPINFTITTAGRELHVYRYIESESIYILHIQLYTHVCPYTYLQINQVQFITQNQYDKYICNHV